jgi:hypothetical protein
MADPIKFRLKFLDLTKTKKTEVDFDYVANALNFLHVDGWDLNKKLYSLLVDGFLLNEDNTRMVMLLGVYAGGTEDLISSPLISSQMGAPIPPQFLLIKDAGKEIHPSGG